MSKLYTFSVPYTENGTAYITVTAETKEEALASIEDGDWEVDYTISNDSDIDTYQPYFESVKETNGTIKTNQN